ncbi:MAG: formylglycine-generating enzyme family protein [Synechococcaceae cyanobacterium SM1_2_3]|nr:formylglycine-generating enzyme family protein [Synechococcaceae cyanobacterium SM1_2_3]
MPQTSFFIHTDRERLTFRQITRPPWANAIGRDRFGLWSEITIAPEDNEPVTQRLRWIPPGRFWMGSPEDEPGRYDDEGPRHQVTLTEGYWLFDTPCTQALWAAVMGNNPSKFQSPTRPVEQVSWDDVQSFLGKLNERIPGLDLTLPSEAQWEYACRAGTETAIYIGDLAILGKNNAPALDPIAWYGGNSGIDFELTNGYDSSGWPEKQYRHAQAGTHTVKLKQANSWGLYDMLGNVWEWCRDGRRDYDSAAQTDPEGSLEIGADRVLRGGSWYFNARLVRARTATHATPATASSTSVFAVSGFSRDLVGQRKRSARNQANSGRRKAGVTRLRAAERGRDADKAEKQSQQRLELNKLSSAGVT